MRPYKGYIGSLEYSVADECFHGRVLGIRDTVTFEATNAQELEKAFRDSLDDYLGMCADDGIEPERPFSGKLAFRTTPEHHRLITDAAAASAKSINQWMDDVLTDAANRKIESGFITIRER